VFYQLGDGLHCLFWGFDATTKDLGLLAPIGGTLLDVKVFERQDLDSGQGDVVLFSEDNQVDRFELLPIVGFSPGAKQPIATFPKSSTNGWAVVYNVSATNRSFVVATGTQLWGVPLDQGQLGNPWNKDFGVSVRLDDATASGVLGALVVRDDVHQQFWWEPVTDTLGQDVFRSGVLPYTGAAAPLTTDGKGDWAYLSGTAGAQWTWTSISPTVTSKQDLSGLAGDLIVWVSPRFDTAMCILWGDAGVLDGLVLSSVGGARHFAQSELPLLTQENANLTNSIYLARPQRAGFFWGELPRGGTSSLSAGKSWGLGNTIVFHSWVMQ